MAYEQKGGVARAEIVFGSNCNHQEKLRYISKRGKCYITPKTQEKKNFFVILEEKFFFYM